MKFYLGLSSKRWRQLLIINGVVALPFLLLSSFGALENENAMILLPLILTGFPWILLYLLLPFEIPGFTSAGLPDAQGNLLVSPLHIVLFLIPTFINMYLLFYMRFRKEKSQNVATL